MLEKKPGAMAGSTPLQQWRQAGRWPECLDRIWQQLEQRHGKSVVHHFRISPAHARGAHLGGAKSSVPASSGVGGWPHSAGARGARRRSLHAEHGDRKACGRRTSSVSSPGDGALHQFRFSLAHARGAHLGGAKSGRAGRGAPAGVASKLGMGIARPADGATVEIRSAPPQEREYCARIAEAEADDSGNMVAKRIAQKIRARHMRRLVIWGAAKTQP